MFNLHMILSDTVKMKEYQEVSVMFSTGCFCCSVNNVQLSSFYKTIEPLRALSLVDRCV